MRHCVFYLLVQWLCGYVDVNTAFIYIRPKSSVPANDENVRCKPDMCSGGLVCIKKLIFKSGDGQPEVKFQCEDTKRSGEFSVTQCRKCYDSDLVCYELGTDKYCAKAPRFLCQEDSPATCIGRGLTCAVRYSTLMGRKIYKEVCYNYAIRKHDREQPSSEEGSNPANKQESNAGPGGIYRPITHKSRPSNKTSSSRPSDNRGPSQSSNSYYRPYQPRPAKQSRNEDDEEDAGPPTPDGSSYLSPVGFVESGVVTPRPRSSRRPPRETPGQKPPKQRPQAPLKFPSVPFGSAGSQAVAESEAHAVAESQAVAEAESEAEAEEEADVDAEADAEEEAL